jgi:hypothetical protein
MIRVSKFILVLSILVNIIFGFSRYQVLGTIPVTGNQIAPFSVIVKDQSTVSSINEFVETIKDGNKNSIRGVYLADIFALRVVEQPANNPNFVSSIEGVATQFALANKYSTIGFLAHNFLSGKYFFDMNLGDIVQVIYGDGKIDQFRVTHIFQFQALQPNSPKSQFVDLQNGEKLSSTQLFEKMYTGKKHITFQTCIQKDGIDSWGRLFLIATPLEEKPAVIPE